MTTLGLKIIAILTMFIDHYGMLYGNDLFLRTIGRIAFVLYTFMIIQGWNHTTDKKRYLLKLFFLAIISEIPFNMFTKKGSILNPNIQNVIFTYLFGITALYFQERNEGEWYNSSGWVIASFLAGYLNTDYHFAGIFLLWFFSYIYNKETFWNLLLGISVFCVLCFVGLKNPILYITNYARSGVLAYFGVFLSLPFLYSFILSRKHIPLPRWFSLLYWSFYPLHMFILAWTKYGFFRF